MSEWLTRGASRENAEGGPEGVRSEATNNEHASVLRSVGIAVAQQDKQYVSSGEVSEWLTRGTSRENAEGGPEGVRSEATNNEHASVLRSVGIAVAQQDKQYVSSGEVSEWLKEHAWKVCIRE